MTRDDAFLRAIMENPEDDAPRLLYADWLEECGRAEWAEFIRVQCRLARLSADDAVRPRLEERERHLLQKHGEEWAGPLNEGAGTLKDLVPRYSFHRGFVGAVSLCPEEFLSRAPAILGLSLVRRVDFKFHSDRPDETLSRLDASPPLGRLESIGFSFRHYCVSDAGFLALAASPRLLRRMDSLGVVECNVTQEGVGPVVLSPHLRRLGRLWLSRCLLRGEVGVRPIAESPRLGRLNSLSPDKNALGAEGIRLLAASPNCGALTTLDLCGCGAGDEGASALARSPHLGRLWSLGLDDNEIGNAGVAAIAASSRLGCLEVLTLADNNVTDVGAAYLAGAAGPKRLRVVGLRDNPISEAGRARLRARFGEGAMW